jgi:rod shape-determining protein MreC
VRGDGEEPLKLLYLLQSDDVAPGDNLITSGAAGVFPKGLLVGTVKEVVKQSRGGFLLVNAEPAVDFSRLEEVLVILRQSRFARQEQEE